VPIEASSRVKLRLLQWSWAPSRRGPSRPRSRPRSGPPAASLLAGVKLPVETVPLDALARPAFPLTGATVATLLELRDGVLEEGHEPFSVTVIVWTPALAFGWTKICENAVPPSVVSRRRAGPDVSGRVGDGVTPSWAKTGSRQT